MPFHTFGGDVNAHNDDLSVTNPQIPTPVVSRVSTPHETITTGQQVEPTDEENPRTGFDWKRLIDDSLNAQKFQGTLLVFAFVVLRVLLVAKTDVLTAVAIINGSGIVAVVVGTVLSALPILTAGLFVVIVYRVAAGTWKFETSLGIVALGLAALAVVLSTPWFALPLGVLTLSVCLFIRRGKFQLWQPVRPPWRVFLIQLLLICVLLSPLGVVAKDALFVMWLPREMLQLRDDHQPLVGYVLEDKEGWVTVLKTVERKVVRIHSERIVGRTVCRKNDHESIWQLFRRRIMGVDTRVTECPRSGG
jgi:hypothetical protein